jgi:hypothetical protein
MPCFFGALVAGGRRGAWLCFEADFDPGFFTA